MMMELKGLVDDGDEERETKYPTDANLISSLSIHREWFLDGC